MLDKFWDCRSFDIDVVNRSELVTMYRCIRVGGARQ